MIRAPRSTRPRGFTAFEALLAAAILAFMTAAITGALMAGRMQSKLARDTLYASMLAHAMMDEVMRLSTADPAYPSGYTVIGPDTGEARIPAGTQTQFNCVKDYNNYTDGPNNIMQLGSDSLHCTAYPDVYQNYVRTVTIESISYTPSGWNRTISALLITVTVTRDGQQLIKLQRVACN
jgi:type II secretory pathway pseudopilin PulG